MRTVAYLLAGVLVAPIVLLGAAFQFLDHVISTQSLPRLLLRILDDFVALIWVVPLLVTFLIGWVAGAVLPARCYLGASVTMLAGALALVRVLTLTGIPAEAGQWTLPALAVVGLMLSAWLVVSEWPRVAGR